MSLSINGVRLDDPQRCFVIAEVSGNHHQDYVTAQNLVRAAAEAGANACKFQLISPELICADIPLPFGHDPRHDAWLQQLGVTRMRELFSKGGLPRAWCKSLKLLAESLGIAWLCTPFSVEEARFLVEEVQVETLKIASGDLTFTPLLEYAQETGLPLIVSTGGATMEECETAFLDVLAEAWAVRHVVALHCCSVYPADESMLNLGCIPRMREYLDMPVGLSDHTLSVDMIPGLAVAMGAVCLEKHLRLADDDTSIDAGHSLTPAQFKRMVEAVRAVPAILGNGVKQPHALEMHDRLFARRDPSDWLRPQMRGRFGDWE